MQRVFARAVYTRHFYKAALNLARFNDQHVLTTLALDVESMVKSKLKFAAILQLQKINAFKEVRYVYYVSPLYWRKLKYFLFNL